MNEDESKSGSGAAVVVVNWKGDRKTWQEPLHRPAVAAFIVSGPMVELGERVDQTMNIALPPEIEIRITPAGAKLHMAIGLFAGDEVTLGQAAAVAGISQPEFLQELGKRKLPVHYGPDELDEDIAAVQKMIGT